MQLSIQTEFGPQINEMESLRRPHSTKVYTGVYAFPRPGEAHGIQFSVPIGPYFQHILGAVFIYWLESGLIGSNRGKPNPTKVSLLGLAPIPHHHSSYSALSAFPGMVCRRPGLLSTFPSDASGFCADFVLPLRRNWRLMQGSRSSFFPPFSRRTLQRFHPSGTNRSLL